MFYLKQIPHLIGSLVGALIATGAIAELPLSSDIKHTATVVVAILAYMLGLNITPPKG